MAESGGIDKNADFGELAGDVKRTETVASVRGNVARNAGADQKSYRETLETAEVERLTQQKKLRKKFFKFCTRLAYGIIGSNTIFFGWYIAWAREDVSTTVFQFWISATVVEILGIVAIIARYLFVHDSQNGPTSAVHAPRFVSTRIGAGQSAVRKVLQKDGDRTIYPTRAFGKKSASEE